MEYIGKLSVFLVEARKERGSGKTDIKPAVEDRKERGLKKTVIKKPTDSRI
ncbi:MAG: hypothetical protein LPK26_14270 [Bacillaceae bacterium]|nr:hypothetical protein [Bacillaceae bacterium]